MEYVYDSVDYLRDRLRLVFVYFKNFSPGTAFPWLLPAPGMGNYVGATSD